MADMIQIRRDTAANWTSVNPVLAQGELGIETDTLKIKAGDGTTVWNSLGYLIDTGGYGTVTSVGVVGGSTGLTTTGGPITTSGNITLTGTLAVANGGTGVTTSTGTGAVVLSTSPVLVTPALGTPSSGTLTNVTGLPPAGVTGTAAILGANTFTALQTEAAGADIASATATDLTAATGNVVVITGTTTATSLTMTKGQQMVLIAAAAWPLTFHATTMNIVGGVSYTCAAGDRLYVVKDDDDVIRVSVIKQDGTAVVAASGGVSYDQNIQSADYTLVIDDAGKQIFHPAADTTERTWTIPANASVAFDIGAVVLFVNDNSAGLLTIGITSDTLEDLSGSTGNMLVAGGNVVTALKVTATKWLAWSENKTASSTGYVACSHDNSPYISVYEWSDSGTFGSKMSDPGTLPTGYGNGVSFSPNGRQIVVAHETTPWATAYPWTSSGFGTKFANPSTIPTGQGWYVAFSPAGTEIMIAHTTSPRISAYPWTSSGFGTKFADPSTLPANNAYGIAFSPAGTEVVVGHANAPGVKAYPWSASGFGTKFADPSSPPTGTGWSAAFAPSGSQVVIGCSSPYVNAYTWSASGFGARLTDPVTVPYTGGEGLAFSPAGSEIFVAHSWSPYLSAYAFTASGFGSKFANPSSLPAGVGKDVCFTTSGNHVLLAHSASPYLTAFEWTGSAFGAKSTPGTVPAGDGTGVSFTTV